MEERFLLAEIDDNGCGFRTGNTNQHRSVGSSIVADRLKILLNSIDFEHAINYLVKDQKKDGETGIKIRIILPFIKEQKENS